MKISTSIIWSFFNTKCLLKSNSREDTAKYLYNLDPNGPYYDPKSRSMRENPFAVSEFCGEMSFFVFIYFTVGNLKLN